MIAKLKIIKLQFQERKSPNTIKENHNSVKGIVKLVTYFDIQYYATDHYFEYERTFRHFCIDSFEILLNYAEIYGDGHVLGIRGQVLYVNPLKKLIMVRLELKDNTYTFIPNLFKQLSTLWSKEHCIFNLLHVFYGIKRLVYLCVNQSLFYDTYY